MKMAPVPADEAERIADLQELGLLDTPRESRFDQITNLMADVFNVPIPTRGPLFDDLGRLATSVRR